MIFINIVKMSEEEIDRIFKEIDKDESGSITKKEAVRACRRSDHNHTICIIICDIIIIIICDIFIIILQEQHDGWP